MANYPQDLAQDAVCQSHTVHMTGLWFLPTRPLRLNTNEWMNERQQYTLLAVNKRQDTALRQVTGTSGNNRAEGQPALWTCWQHTAILSVMCPAAAVIQERKKQIQVIHCSHVVHYILQSHVHKGVLLQIFHRNQIVVRISPQASVRQDHYKQQ